MPRCPVLLVAALGAGVVYAALAAPAAAQPVTPIPGMRTTLDGEPETPLRPYRTKKRRASPQTPPGQVPAYGIPPGAGKTGFVSSNAPRISAAEVYR